MTKKKRKYQGGSDELNLSEISKLLIAEATEKSLSKKPKKILYEDSDIYKEMENIPNKNVIENHQIRIDEYNFYFKTLIIFNIDPKLSEIRNSLSCGF